MPHYGLDNQEYHLMAQGEYAPMMYESMVPMTMEYANAHRSNLRVSQV